MPEQEQRQVWRRENGKLNAILGALVALTLAAGGWVIRVEQRVSTVEETTVSQSQRIEAAINRVRKVEEARAADGLAVARIEERLAAQSDSIRRIETSLGELVRYLRDRDLPAPR